MVEEKECFAFGEKKVCKVCGCDEKGCECELHEEKLKPAEINDEK